LSADGRSVLDGHSRIEIAVLSAPLAVAIVNPGTGLASGYYAAVLVIIYTAFRYGIRAGLTSVDWMALHLSVFILTSPLWAYAPSVTASASHGAAVTLAYFVAIRLTLRQQADFDLFSRLVASMCLVYAGYFLIKAKTMDAQTLRLSVEFANGNYTGAVLAFGTVATLWQVVCSFGKRPSQMLWVAAYVAESWALLETGSRASAAGAAGALAVVLLFKARWRLARNLTLAVLACGFVVGFLPQSAKLFGAVSDAGSSYQPFHRGDQSVLDLSGRVEIWRSTTKLISNSWILGGGIDGYRLRGPTQILAHSWGLEYMASVGVVGTSALAFVIFSCFTGQGFRTALQPSRRAWLWNSATALSLLPNLALSTHQWTLWAWAGFALWSRSQVLDTGLDQPRRIGGTRRPEHAHFLRRSTG
jgi:hypothetical protein